MICVSGRGDATPQPQHVRHAFSPGTGHATSQRRPRTGCQREEGQKGQKGKEGEASQKRCVMCLHCIEWRLSRCLFQRRSTARRHLTTATANTADHAHVHVRLHRLGAGDTTRQINRRLHMTSYLNVCLLAWIASLQHITAHVSVRRRPVAKEHAAKLFPVNNALEKHLFSTHRHMTE